jgi:A/G-specific adenine glycosylase
MLQQTQVERARTFYERFIKEFPDFTALAGAKKSDILLAWQGLGYNRRALALHKSAKIVIEQYGGRLPRDRVTLESLPGIGPYTAGAIRAFAWNDPEVFIETNIRRAFIHFFFPRRRRVHDREILPLIERSLDSEDPRAWYFALMDYGAMLGDTVPRNPNRRSVHYARPSKFVGSDREMRGKVLRLVLARKKIRREDIANMAPGSRARAERALGALVREGFLKEKGGIIISL